MGIQQIAGLSPVLAALLATCFTWAMTALGAAGVFFFKTVNKRVLNAMLGFAAGIMIAASFWSLLAPAIEMSEGGPLPSWFPAVVGFLVGGLFLWIIDRILPHLHIGQPTEAAEGVKTQWQRSVLLVLAITLHNFPEGLAVGVAFGAVAAGLPAASLAGAIALTIGIGLQNLPEGLAVSVPLRREGMSRFQGVHVRPGVGHGGADCRRVGRGRRAADQAAVALRPGVCRRRHDLRRYRGAHPGSAARRRHPRSHHRRHARLRADDVVGCGSRMNRPEGFPKPSVSKQEDLIMLPTIEPGIKVAVQASPEPSEEELALIQQMGVEWVVLWTDESKASADYFASRRKLYEAHGIRVYGFGNWDVHNQDAIVLGLEGRDAKVAQYKQHLRDLSRAGIPYTTYAHMANGIWSTEREADARRGQRARVRCGQSGGGPLDRSERYRVPLSHGRAYSQEEIWDNFASFIQEVAPVAEDAGVKIGIHPDDPPWPELAGIPRCIFSSFDGYQRALDLTGSPNVGVCLCVGCWLEGGPLMGKDVVETIARVRQAEAALQGALP